MRNRRLAAGLLAALALVVAGASEAGAAAYIKFDGIDGESDDPGHKGEITIESFQWGVTHAGAQGGPQASRPRLTFTKSTDNASPKLMLAVLSGQRISCAALSLDTGGESPFTYTKMIFRDIVISSFEMEGGAEGRPAESLSMNYEKVELTYVRQGADGRPGETTSAGWDFLTRKQFSTDEPC